MGMKVAQAKELVLALLKRDIAASGAPIELNAGSPDNDQGKFTLAGRPARVIHPWDGYYINISLKWFQGSEEPPHAKRTPFYWYVFAIPQRGRQGSPHYFICDYK